MRTLIHRATLICLITGAHFLTLSAQDRYTGETFATRSVVVAQHGMICTSQPLATIAGLDVLKKGGTAIDAAIAANAVLGVTEPAMNGVGGDLFAIVYDAKTKKLYGLNASGRSPYGLTLEDFKKQGFQFVNTFGPLGLTVPGCVDGWFELHKRFGKLPMPQLLAAAIGYARNGYPISNEPAFDLKELEKRLVTSPTYNFDFSNTRDLYLPGKNAPLEGQVFRNPDLANTLEKISKGGRDAFYKGEIARTIETYMKRVGGYLSLKDFNDHTSEWVDPVSTTYRGYTVWELPPNGQGITVLQMLNILENFDFSTIRYGSAEHLHLLAEAAKLAYTDRAKFYADPQFVKIPTTQLISKEYAKSRSELIDRAHASFNFIAGDTLLKTGETTYVTAADEFGNMVSLIQSNYHSFGSRMVPDGLGFVLQNRGASFNLREGENNVYAPHKRPFHTIIPAFVTKDNQPFMSFGVMGGSFQPMGHVQILMNIIDFGMNVQEAGDAPRIHVDGTAHPDGTKKSREFLLLEAGFADQTIRDLINMGHTDLRHGTGGLGGYQGIRYDTANKVYHGASDPRKDGMAAGY
jgi:gamma-glutamyltranspeptidase / glutathione hydrolase